MRGGDAEVVEIVTTNSDANTMDLLFVWTEGGNEADIGDFAAAWDRRQRYEVNGVGASGNAGADTLGDSSKVVSVGADPDGLVWTADEVMVFEILAGPSVNDGVGFGAVGAGADWITRGSQIVGVGWNDVRVGTERSESVRREFSRGRDEMWRRNPQR